MGVNSGGNHLVKEKAVFIVHVSKSPNCNFFPMLKHNSMLHDSPQVKCYLLFYRVRTSWKPWVQRCPETCI